MNKKEKVLGYLLDATSPCSGEELAKKLNITRAGVWKIIKALKEDGYQIIGKPNEGYQLNKEEIPLHHSLLEKLIDHKLDIEVFDTIDSTSTYAKNNAHLHHNDYLVASLCQTHGRGRRGNDFISPLNSCYFTLALHPDVPLEKLSLITIRVGVALIRTLKKYYQIDLQIKWVNDLFYDKRKCGGILLEATSDVESGNIDTLFIGVGINLNQETFDESIKDIASSLKIPHVNLNEFIAHAVNEIFDILNEEAQVVLDEYTSCLILLDQEVHFIQNGVSYHGLVRGVNTYGHLIVETTQGLMTLKSGEVSLSSRQIVSSLNK